MKKRGTYEQRTRARAPGLATTLIALGSSDPKKFPYMAVGPELVQTGRLPTEQELSGSYPRHDSNGEATAQLGAAAADQGCQPRRRGGGIPLRHYTAGRVA